MGCLCVNFSLPMPLCSRLRPDVRDRQTDRRQTSDAHHRLMPRLLERGIINVYASYAYFPNIVSDSVSNISTYYRHCKPLLQRFSTPLDMRVTPVFKNPIHFIFFDFNTTKLHKHIFFQLGLVEGGLFKLLCKITR